MKKLNSIYLISLLILIFFSCQNDDDLTVDSKEELEEKLRTEFVNEDLMSISYSVVKNNTLLHSGAYGFADQANNIIATNQTRYLIASISKTITGVALMQLVEQNLISLDDDINEKLPFSVRNPNFPNDKITYRMLLSHTSSISDNFQENFDLDCFGVDCVMSLSQYFNEVFLQTGAYYAAENFSNNTPGTSDEYSNLATALIGYLVERITSVPFDEYGKNNIFIPLGMNKTEWRLAHTPLSEIAIPYSDEITSPNPHYTFPDYPNGGLRTNVLDLSNFLMMVIQDGNYNGEQILSTSNMQLMKSLQYESADQCLSFYYEHINGKRLLGHSGGEKGATAEMYYDTNTNVGAIVLSNEEDAYLDDMLTLLINYGEKQ